MKKQTSILFCFIVFLLSCSNAIDRQYKIISISNNSLSEFGNLDKYISYNEFIPLETNPQALIGQIDKIIQYDNEFYILDSEFRNNILRFNSKGKFLGLIISDDDKQMYKILTIKDFDILDGKIVFIDYFNHFIFSKSLKSGLLTKFSIPGSSLNVKFLDTNKFLIYSGYGNNNDKNSRIILFECKDSNCNVFNQFLPSDSVLNNAMDGSASLRFLKYGNYHLIHEFGNDTIYSIREKYSRIEYILNFEDNTVMNYMYNKDFQSVETHQEYVRKNKINHKLFDMFLFDNLLSIDCIGANGRRQLIYDTFSDTIISYCNFYEHKTENLPITFIGFHLKIILNKLSVSIHQKI